MIKTDWLLPNEMLDLRGDLEKLILYSASKATWAKHCSAWKLYDKFCQIYNIRFELPFRVHHIFEIEIVKWLVVRKNGEITY